VGVRLGTVLQSLQPGQGGWWGWQQHSPPGGSRHDARCDILLGTREYLLVSDGYLCSAGAGRGGKGSLNEAIITHMQLGVTSRLLVIPLCRICKVRR
jgi:hypothetical protein